MQFSDEKSVARVSDSTRYFVARIDSQSTYSPHLQIKFVHLINSSLFQIQEMNYLGSDLMNEQMQPHFILHSATVSSM